MCISARPAEFSGTSILLNLTRHPRHGQIFVLGYQNTAISHDGPNALLLHLPALGMTRENFIDSQGCSHIFADLREATMPTPAEREKVATLGSSRSVQIFEHGIYTVVLALDARFIPATLKRVAENKRPVISEELCEFYTTYRPGWPIALCCFDNREARKAEPVFVWYNPINPDVLTAPGIDCHTGGVPDLDSKVHVDHQIFLATDDMLHGSDVDYSSRATREKMSDFLPKRAFGMKIQGSYLNGDFAVTLDHLTNGTPHLRRLGAWNPLGLVG